MSLAKISAGFGKLAVNKNIYKCLHFRQMILYLIFAVKCFYILHMNLLIQY